jgi:hypothetical protein
MSAGYNCATALQLMRSSTLHNSSPPQPSVLYEQQLDIDWCSSVLNSINDLLPSCCMCSHILFSVYLEMRTSEEASEKAVVSKLHLVWYSMPCSLQAVHLHGGQLGSASLLYSSS